MALFQAAEETNLKVTGMHCEKCVAHVKEALEGVDGVMSAAVSLADECALVTGTAARADLIAAVEAAGFAAE